jgi:hypothetical protein
MKFIIISDEFLCLINKIQAGQVALSRHFIITRKYNKKVLFIKEEQDQRLRQKRTLRLHHAEDG